MPVLRAPKGPVHAVGKAMELLELLLRARRPLSLQELCAQSGYPKSTAHALAATLREYDMIAQTPDGRYTLGMKLYECGCAVSGGWDVKEAARPYLEQLARQVGWGSYLALRSGDHVLTVDRCSGSTGAGLQLTVEPGIPLPLHATAQGKLLLSFEPEGEIRRVCRLGLPPCTRHTITDEAELLAALRRVREQGYAVEDGEYKVGLRAVAAPVYDASGSVCCALGVVGLFPRTSSDEFQAAVAAACRTAAALSAALGCR